MRFAHPGWFILLLALPLIYAFFRLNARVQGRRRRQFVSDHLYTRLLPTVSRRKQRLKQLALLAGTLALIVALARPQYGSDIHFVKKRGCDIAIVLDTSASMRATDLQPSRFDRGLHVIRKLVRQLDGDRVALVGFAGEAFVQSPLTSDYDAYLVLLDALEVGSIPLPGTNLERALTEAARVLQPATSNGHRAAIILLTDGEDHLGEVDTISKQLADAEVPVFTIGLGTDSGAPIATSGGVYKKDRDGTVIISKLDSQVLQQIAEATGGQFYYSTPNESEVDDILGTLAGFEKRELLSRQVDTYAERFQWLLGAALLLLAGDMIMGVRR